MAGVDLRYFIVGSLGAVEGVRLMRPYMLTVAYSRTRGWFAVHFLQSCKNAPFLGYKHLMRSSGEAFSKKYHRHQQATKNCRSS